MAETFFAGGALDEATEVPAEPARPGKLPPGTGGIKGKRPSKKDKLRAAAAAASDQGNTRN